MNLRVPVLLATALAVTLTAGCGLISAAGNVASVAGTLGDFSERLGKAALLTYTAEYEVTDSGTVTLVNQPPKAAYLAGTGRFIISPEATYSCDAASGRPVCQKYPGQSGGDASTAGLAAGVVGPGFVTPELAIGMIAAAAINPTAKVTKSNRKIAGQDSLCADVTGASDGKGTTGEFSVCVTDAGVLSSFKGSLSTGERGEIVLTRYSTSVDPAAFRPPADAKIVDTVTAPPS